MQCTRYLDDNIRFTPREAAYVAFAVLSSDDVVRAACFGIDCSFNDVNKIDAIVEKLYRDAKLQKAAASDNDDDDYGEKEEPEMDSELEEMAEQQFLTKYGLRENLVAILKKEGTNHVPMIMTMTTKKKWSNLKSQVLRT